jgi:hypothetical protein
MNPVFPFPAVIAIKIRKIIDHFKQHGAVTPDRSQPLEKLGLSKSHLMRRLIRRGVIIEISPGKYYLNEDNLAVFNQNRRTRAGIILVILIVAIAIYVILHLNS